jgi:hypothetical protein
VAAFASKTLFCLPRANPVCSEMRPLGGVETKGPNLDMQRTWIKRETDNQWRVVVVLLLVGVIATSHVGKLPPALHSIRAQLGLDIVTAGWLASMF